LFAWEKYNARYAGDNMTPELFDTLAISPAMKLLPPKMDSPEARAMIVAICLQESRLKHRRQIKGPARGFAQFEMGGGVNGVLNHPVTKSHIEAVLSALGYDYEPLTSHTAMEHNDVLCVCFARLLLWTLPGKLKGPGDAEEAWQQYISAWRPGKPHRGSWDECYKRAWDVYLAKEGV
jgi:hypothetical protein